MSLVFVFMDQPFDTRNKRRAETISALLVTLVAFALLFGGCRRTSGPPIQPANGQATSTQAKARATNDAPALRQDIGFASLRKLQEHYEKHGHEFGSPGQDEYLRQAQVLRDRPAGENVLEVTRADGVITRFEKTTGAFLAFNSDRTIRTYFKPNDGEAYFWRQSKRPGR